MTCRIPHHPPGTVSVAVSLNGQDASNPLPLTFRARGVVAGAIPSVGTSHGGTVVSFAATNLDTTSDVTCLFGDEEVPGLVVSPSRAVCTAPKHPAGRVSLVVTANTARVSPDGFQFLYIDPPSILSIAPTAGPARAAVAVVVRGVGFRGEGMTCMFGAKGVEEATSMGHDWYRNRAVAASVASSTLLRCVSRGHAAGVFPVTVSANALEHSNALAFTVQELPRVDRATPCHGRIAGKTLNPKP